MDKRQFLTAAAALVATPALAQKQATDELGRTLASMKPKAVPRRKAKTTKLFLTPPSWPNAITADPQGRGFWVQQQRHDSGPETAWLLDFKSGKVLHSVVTECVDCSGMAVGNGFVWSGANGASVHNPPDPPVEGVFQTVMNGKTVSHRQIPFGARNNGGSCHGLAWENSDGGGLWIQSNRLEALVRVNPVSWGCDYMFPAAQVDRLHGIEVDGAFIWQVYGTQDPKRPGYDGYTPGLVKYDIKKGEPVEFMDFVPGSCDMHDVCVLDGQLYGVDAGEHPGWPIDDKYARPGFPPLNSPSGGYIFKIDPI